MSTLNLSDFVGFKTAARPRESLAFAGKLVKSSSGWVLLEIPNAFVRGAFMALDAPGTQLPYHGEGRLNAHISVMRPEELTQLGESVKLHELGKRFKFQVGPLKEVEPLGWKAVERVWMLSVESPELEDLRKSYGLPPKPRKGDQTLPFHITIAIRKRGVLARSKTRKEAAIF